MSNNLLSKEQTDFIRNVVVFGTWSINQETGLIDVDGNIRVTKESLNGKKELTVSFGELTGNISAYECGLVTLKGMPIHIKGNGVHNFRDNPLERIEWEPTYVNGYISIRMSKIEKDFHGVIISEIDPLVDRGVSLHLMNIYYYNYRTVYFAELNSKLVELL